MLRSEERKIQSDEWRAGETPKALSVLGLFWIRLLCKPLRNSSITELLALPSMLSFPCVTVPCAALLSSPNQASCERQLGKHPSISSVCTQRQHRLGSGGDSTAASIWPLSIQVCRSRTLSLLSPWSWVLGSTAFWVARRGKAHRTKCWEQDEVLEMLTSSHIRCRWKEV